MPTTTTTYSFNKPVVGADEDDWGGYLNGNWDSVDDLLDGTTPVTGIDINSGTLDGVTIGGTTAGAGTFTTLTANTSITGTLATAAQTNITSVGTLTSLGVSGDLTVDTNTLYVDSANNRVGIGTTSPSQQLHLSGSTPIIRLTDTDTSAYGEISSSSSDGNLMFFADQGNTQANTTIRFYVDASERMRIDSSGQLLLGTTSGTVYYNSTSTYNLSAAIKTDNASEVAELGIINGNNNFGSTVDFLRTNSAGNDVRIANFGGYADSNTAGSEAGHLRFNIKGSSDSNIVEAMRIDSSGNVGIGTASPVEKLHIKGTNPRINVEGDASSYYPSIRVTGINGGVSLGTYYGGNISGENGIVFLTGSSATDSGTQRMKLDSSGNLLVGSTNNSPATNNVAGSSHGSLGNIQASVDGNPCLFVNRKSNDGDIISIRKDGSAVGKISVADSDNVGFLSTVSNHGGIICGTSSIVPALSGTYSNGQTDIGTGTSKWRDIHLSRNLEIAGAVVFDGNSTGLDDYEEGTWTPEMADASSGGTVATGGIKAGRYVKIGKMVHIYVVMLNMTTSSLGSSNNLYIRNLPFTPLGSGTTYPTAAIKMSQVTFSGYCTAQVQQGETAILINETTSGATYDFVECGQVNSGTNEFLIQAAYEVN